MNINLHQKDTERQLLGASCIYIKYITNYEMKPVALLSVKIETSALMRIVGNVVRVFY
jgi:hypothetical protein